MNNKRHFQTDDSGANISGAIGISEHTLVRVMAGEPETLRPRLADALEQLGYRVLDDNPLRAKHGARGWAAQMLSANALDYPTSLDIGLKQQGTGATRVTFDYSVMHGHFGKGDRQSLTREAEAIMALAAARATQTNCMVCGADFISESRFCRKCGAPTASASPAELEVMRLTANVRAGHQWTMIGLVILAFTMVLPFLISLGVYFSGNQKGFKVMLMFTVIGGLLGALAMLSGILKTHRTLNPRDQKEEYLPLPKTPVLSVPRTNELELEPVRERLSITEGTTDLLHEDNVNKREALPVFRKDAQ